MHMRLKWRCEKPSNLGKKCEDRLSDLERTLRNHYQNMRQAVEDNLVAKHPTVANVYTMNYSFNGDELIMMFTEKKVAGKITVFIDICKVIG